MENNKRKKVWFSAMKYGYGWGIPNSWEGWAVYIVYFFFSVSGAFFVKDPFKMLLYLIFLFILTLVLIFLCLKKGKKPEFRWGSKDE